MRLGPSVIAILLSLSPLATAQSFTYSTFLSLPPTSRKGPASPGVPIIDPAGNLYAASQSGGTYGYGTVFKVTPSRQLITLHSFGGSSSDGTYPWEPLTRDAHGNLYGSTETGGANRAGILYQLSPAGAESILYTFPAGSGQENSNVWRDSATGAFYGYGDLGGYGNVFAISGGVQSTLFAFCYQLACVQSGMSPQGWPIQNRAGSLVGEVNASGPDNCGGIFTLTPSGVFSMLYAFDGANDGCGPWIKPSQDSAGNIYGVTYQGGPNGTGVVFKVTPDGIESVLYDFPPGITAESPITVDGSGNLYGIMGLGSESSVYMITPGGVFTTIGRAPGPAGLGYGVVVDKAGNVYGTQPAGGVAHTGSVWKLTRH